MDSSASEQPEKDDSRVVVPNLSSDLSSDKQDNNKDAFASESKDAKEKPAQGNPSVAIKQAPDLQSDQPNSSDVDDIKYNKNISEDGIVLDIIKDLENNIENNIFVNSKEPNKNPTNIILNENIKQQANIKSYNQITNRDLIVNPNKTYAVNIENNQIALDKPSKAIFANDSTIELLIKDQLVPAAPISILTANDLEIDISRIKIIDNMKALKPELSLVATPKNTKSLMVNFKADDVYIEKVRSLIDAGNDSLFQSNRPPSNPS